MSLLMSHWVPNPRKKTKREYTSASTNSGHIGLREKKTERKGPCETSRAKELFVNCFFGKKEKKNSGSSLIHSIHSYCLTLEVTFTFNTQQQHRHKTRTKKGKREKEQSRIQIRNGKKLSCACKICYMELKLLK